MIIERALLDIMRRTGYAVLGIGYTNSRIQGNVIVKMSTGYATIGLWS